MNLPITSRIKRSPLLSDPVKKGKTAKANSIKEGDKKEVVVKGKKVTDAIDALNATKIDKGPDYKPSAAETARANKEKQAALDLDAANSTQDSIKLEGGDDEIVSTDLYQDRKQKVLSNADVANAQFATNRTTRNLERTGNRADKITSKIEDLVAKYDKSTTDKDGNVIKADGVLSKDEYKTLSKGSFFGLFGNDRKKYDKLQRKKSKYKSRTEQFKSADENQKRSQESGRSWNDETKTTDRLKTKGEYGDPAQLKMEKDKLAVEKARLKAAKNQNITTGQAAGAIEAPTTNAPIYNYSQENKSTPLGMKSKSPAYKMKGSMFQKRY